MNVDVFDTYVTHGQSARMHFDVLLPQGATVEQATASARHWLDRIGINADAIEIDQCRFCHSEAVQPELERDLGNHGYAILQMEGCPSPIF